MSDTPVNGYSMVTIWLFWIYLGLKLSGYFTAWSWWWLLLPLIPFIGTAIEAAR